MEHADSKVSRILSMYDSLRKGYILNKSELPRTGVCLSA